MHKQIIALLLASWTMFNHEGLISTKSIIFIKSWDEQWTGTLRDLLHTGVIP